LNQLLNYTAAKFVYLRTRKVIEMHDVYVHVCLQRPKVPVSF